MLQCCEEASQLWNSRFSSLALTTDLPEIWSHWLSCGFTVIDVAIFDCKTILLERALQALQAYNYLDLYSHRPNTRPAHVEGQLRRATRPSNDILPSALYAHLPRSFLLGPISADAWLSRRHRLPSLFFSTRRFSLSSSRDASFLFASAKPWLGVENGRLERGRTDLPASGRAYGFWVRFLRRYRNL